MLIESIGLLSDEIEFAQAPECDCGCSGKTLLAGKQFRHKKEIVGVAMNICDEWDCPHTFAFVKYYNGECVGAFHLIKDTRLDDEDFDNYEWKVLEFDWSDKKAIREIKEINLNSLIHFATIFEEDKDGNFATISE